MKKYVSDSKINYRYFRHNRDNNLDNPEAASKHSIIDDFAESMKERPHEQNFPRM